MKRINLSFTDRQYKRICENAKALEVKAGTFAKLCTLSAIGAQFIPQPFELPRKIKQTDLFERSKKS